MGSNWCTNFVSFENLFSTERIMAFMSIVDRLKFESDLCAIKAKVWARVTENYFKRKDSHWKIWESYCHKTHVDSFHLNVENPNSILEIYQRRLQDGQLAPSSQQIRSQTVPDYLISAGQMFTNLVLDNLLLNKFGKMDFCLAWQPRGYKKKDNPTVCVKPLPVLVAMAALMHDIIGSCTVEKKSIANMICIAFFYCMRPNE